MTTVARSVIRPLTGLFITNDDTGRKPNLLCYHFLLHCRFTITRQQLLVPCANLFSTRWPRFSLHHGQCHLFVPHDLPQLARTLLRDSRYLTSPRHHCSTHPPHFAETLGKADYDTTQVIWARCLPKALLLAYNSATKDLPREFSAKIWCPPLSLRTLLPNKYPKTSRLGGSPQPLLAKNSSPRH